MSDYRNTQDIMTRALKKAGEPTNGNSAYVESMNEYLSDVQRAIVAGGTVFGIHIDEVWPWAKAKQPLVINLLPRVTAGTLSLTNGLLTGAFSSAPSVSYTGWFFRSFPETSDNTTYRIAQHTAGGTAFVLDSPYLGTTSTVFAYELFKLDYDLLPDYIYINPTNDKLDFSENGTTELTASLTNGAYTPAALATEIAAKLNAIGGANVYTVGYDTQERTFTMTSNLSVPSSVFQLWGKRGTFSGKQVLGTVGFNTQDYTGAATYESTYALGGISRLIEPIRVYGPENRFSELLGLDPLVFSTLHLARFSEQATPTAFTKIAEDSDGKITLRFNSYPEFTSRCEVEYVPVPRDLQNNEASIPLLPVKYFPLLEYAAVYFLFLEKEDTKADQYLALAKAELETMQKHYRSEERRTDRSFGHLSPRSGGNFNSGYWKVQRMGYDKGRW